VSSQKTVSSGKTALTVLAPVAGPAEAEALRLLAWAKAVGKAQWILVDEGEGLAARLAQDPFLKPLKASAMSGPPSSGDWNRYALAAPQALGGWCLLLPRDAPAAPALFKGLSAAASSAELVFSRRPGGSAWAYMAEDWLWQLPGLDLGSPLLASRERLLSLVGAVKAGPFMGPRLARVALKSGVPVLLCAAHELAAAKHGFSVLGESVGARKFFMAIAQVAAGGVAFLAGLYAVMPISHFFGLCLIGAGFFLVSTVLGKE
jgi:hypothetical protein